MATNDVPVSSVHPVDRGLPTSLQPILADQDIGASLSRALLKVTYESYVVAYETKLNWQRLLPRLGPDCSNGEYRFKGDAFTKQISLTQYYSK